MAEVFIDLDRPEGRADPDEPEPARRPGRRHIRAVALAAGAVLLLAVPTLSLRPRPLITQLGLFPRPAKADQSLALVGDAVMVMAEGAVTAFDFDGTKRWSYQSDEPAEYVYVEEAPRHGVFLLVTMRHNLGAGRSSESTQTRVIALDRQTGAPRWHVDDYTRLSGDLVIGGTPHSIQVYHGSPPALRWQHADLADWTMDPRAATAWTFAHDGTLSERDLATGEVRRSHKLPRTGNLAAMGGRVFVYGDDSTVTAYDAATLEQVEWARNWSPSGECGPVFCATMRSSGLPSMGGVDRQSGRLLWILPANQFAWPSDVGLVALNPASTSGMAPLVGVVDPMTGQLRMPLPGWQLLSSNRGILVRPNQGRLHMARLKPDGARLLGSVPHRPVSCSSTAGGDVVMCDLTDGRVGVWRLAP